MRLIHLTGPSDADEALLLLDDDEERAEEHCPAGWKVESDTHIEASFDMQGFSSILPTGRLMMKRGAY